MQSFFLKDITNIVSGEYYGINNIQFRKLITDSRTTGNSSSDLFIAITGIQHDGHKFINELYKNGVRAFILSKDIQFQNYPEAGFIKVKNTIEALHALASYKRNMFDIPVIGITGSNGKTIVKEWLSWILNNKFKITRNPKSYNSQTGVPLSLWLLEKDSELGIFEAGISQPGEMEKLEKLIKPTIGILTNIGSAHQANFSSVEEKTTEKLKLFKDCKTVIYNSDDQIADRLLKSNNKIEQFITWSENNNGLINIKHIEYLKDKSKISLLYDGKEINFSIPYSDKGSVQNAISCFCVLVALKIDIHGPILKRFASLPNVKMRLEMLKGIHNSVLINDSYNSDINSFEIALDFLNRKKGNRNSIVIMSDILQSSDNEKELYQSVSKLINEKNINRFIGIGKALSAYKKLFHENALFFNNTEEFINDLKYSDFYESAILLKGARDFRFEKISSKLQAKNHETVIETDLNLIKYNLDFFKSHLAPGTKIMAMVKAFSYGSGYVEIASLLQHNRINYLAVAFVDEGIELREGGITTPIMVMNPNLQSLQSMISYRLEPEIYSLTVLRELIRELENNDITDFPIHIKLDTGMHRLGLTEADIDEFCKIINNTKTIKLTSIFSHLAGSDDKNLDYFTKQQVELFLSMYDKICQLTSLKPDRHILNTNGIIRFPEYDFEMVRLGIGMYGLIPELKGEIFQVSRFKSVISQIHHVKKGESISYNRSGKVDRESVIATIPVGYADGLDRRLGNGNWYFYVNSHKAFTIGNICMDMCMIDITDIPANEGDEVIIFGKRNSILEMAEILNTIPYEIITGISQRVKRVYYEE
ncbi:MAG: bifunctional UDP-N-acetylmuramoyl-tripeptide:D-alanyl-D-alanine ligase/alanine racemase [Bacteroidales bacterium]|jgi:alanine racemase|nr:bifunctional UDP-N-acetylmuramoyl-tripeptide:D-alanyl-D-alanine ligase/alanine racemase [Bacteroidales bacterium]